MSKRLTWLSFCLALAWSLLLGQDRPAGKTVKEYTIEQFMNTEAITGGAISHDDQLILYSSRSSGIFNAFTVPISGGKSTQLTDSKTDSVFVISFFPRDNRILYSSDKGGNEIAHIYLRKEDGQVQDLTPDEKARAVFYDWSYDGNSFFYGSNKRDPKFMDVYEMDVAGMQPKMVYRNEAGYEFGAVSDDKRYLALVKPITTSNTDIYLFDSSNQQLKHLTPHTGDMVFYPAGFSVDSKSLYYRTDQGSEFTYLKRYDIGTGKSEKVEEAKWDIMYAYLSKQGKYRVTAVNNDARTEIRVLDTKDNKLVQLPDIPNADITGVRISDSEKVMLFYVNGSRSPSNIYVYEFATGRSRKLTDTMNPEINPEDLVEATVVRFKSFDGMEIPALLYKPHRAEAGRKMPALVSVHGGPGGQARFGYSPLKQYLVNHGYAIIDVNNRGSSGYGKTFYKADDLKHGNEDLNDCVAAKKFLAGTGWVDKNRIGIMGGSYGGYMTLAGLAFRPDEFAVGVDIFGVSNWVRTLKSTPPWWAAFREALFKELGNPETQEQFLRDKSPLFHADKIQKPLIVLQGANDPRVLKVESDEIVAALKKNEVPVEYVVFPDEGHGFVKKENEIKGYGAILRFLDRHLKGSTG